MPRWVKGGRPRKEGTGKYYRYREQYIKATIKYASKKRAFLHWLKAIPCVDCGGTFHPVCMDFDHVRGEKLSGVQQMLTYSWDRLADEILKCEIVCANCHRIRTWVRENASK